MERANGCLWCNSFTLGGRGNFGGHEAFGHALAGVAGDNWWPEVKLLAIKVRFRLQSWMEKLKLARRWKKV